MTDGKITIGTVCFISDSDKKQMLLLRRARNPMQGFYTGIGGKTEFQEDIRTSVLREVAEETGLEVTGLCLKGVVKTILQAEDKASSSWILFIYTAVCDSFNFIDCPEGELVLADISRLGEYDLIGFIREMMPLILNGSRVFEGTIVHDGQGCVMNSFFS